MVKVLKKKNTLGAVAANVEILSTKVEKVEFNLEDLSIRLINLSNTVDNLAAMCMREFTAIREIMEKMNTRLETAGARLDNLSEIVLEDHKPRIRALEKEVFLD